MKTTHKIKQLNTSKRLLNIQVPAEEIAICYEEAYKEIQKDASIPGFRKGNAPLELIKKEYKDYAAKKVLEYVVEESYHEAMKEAGLLPVGLPKVENVKFPEGAGLSFDATVEIRPKPAIKTYKGLKVKRKDDTVKDAEIDAAIENLRQLGAQYKPVPARPIKEGDFLLCDMEWFVEGKSIEKREKITLALEKKTLTEPLFNGILSSNVGEKKSISVNIDKSFHKPEYVGKTANLEILIHEIKQKELPPLDDEFAKDLGPFENINHLRDKIKERLSQQKKAAGRLDMEDQLIQQLLNCHSFEVPQSLVESEFKNMFQEAEQKLLYQGKSLKDARETLEKEKDSLRQKLHSHAENQVKTFFILEEIAEKENLSVTEEELNQFIDALAERQTKQPQALRKQLEQEGRLNGIYWQLTEAKVMRFLLDNAKLEEEN